MLADELSCGLTDLDVLAAAIGVGALLLHGSIKARLVAAGKFTTPDPLAVQMRTVAFLRDLDLDPRLILGDVTVQEVDHHLPHAA